MMTARWNTGRLYAAEGQVVVATWHSDGVITFMDHSRGIDGELTGSWPERPESDRTLRVIVMEEYDHNRYRGSRRAWADGMMGTGCNARSGAAERAVASRRSERDA